MESGHAQNYLIKGIADSAMTAMNGNKRELKPCYKDPLQDYDSLLEFSNGKPITVLDFQPMQQYTVPELVMMAKQLGGDQNVPLCLSDVYKGEDGKWYAQVRDRQNNLTGESIHLEHVLCRSIHSDMKNLEEFCRQNGNLEQLEILKEFLKDAENIKWISHPSHQNIIDKRDLKVLLEDELTQELGLDIFYESEIITKPGKYRQKPLNGNSGSDQCNIIVEAGNPHQVPTGFMCQEYMNLCPFPVKSRFESEIDTATIEIRMMPPTCYNKPWSDRGSYIFIRSAPTTSPIHVREHVRTNFLDIVQAVFAIVEKINQKNSDFLDCSSISPELEKEIHQKQKEIRNRVETILTYKDSPFGVTFAFISE